MKTTHFFELTEPSSEMGYYIMYMIASRCAGESDEDWSSYENATVSIVRSAMNMPEAMENHNVVSNYVFQFETLELADDINYGDNPKVFAIGKAVSKLAIKRCRSHFFIKVELE